MENIDAILYVVVIVLVLVILFPKSKHGPNVLYYQLCHPKALPPEQYGDQYSAGLDLKSCENISICAWERCLVNTGLKLSIPKHCYGRLAPRSGLSLVHSIDIGAGVIDASYEGIVHVVLINNSNKRFNIHIGDRIVQLICERIVLPCVTEIRGEYSSSVNNNNKMSKNSVRGICGFGSSGLR